MTKESLDKAMTRLKEGESEAFDEIYDATYKLVYFVAFGVVRNAQTAEDIVHDTYIAALKHLDSYVDGNAVAWLTTIAQRQALNRYNKAKRERITDFQEEGDAFGFAAVPDEESAGIIALARENLTDEEFNIVIMCAVAGYKRREVAQFTGLPISTVTHKYSVALKKLKKILQGGGQ